MGTDWYKIDGHWCHGPWWKKLVNKCLRAFQPKGPGWKWVVYSKVIPGDPPTCYGYGVGWVEHLE